MAEFSWKSQMQRGDVAGLLLRIAEGLDDGGRVRLRQDAAELKADVPEQVEVSVELGVETHQLQIELEIGWPLAPQTGGQAAGGETSGAGLPAASSDSLRGQQPGEQ